MGKMSYANGDVYVEVDHDHLFAYPSITQKWRDDCIIFMLSQLLCVLVARTFTLTRTSQSI